VADPVKKVSRKLRGREMILVDEQILRWRELRRKNPSLVGKRSARATERGRERTAASKAQAEVEAKTKKWF
jgi:hypothetical protein